MKRPIFIFVLLSLSYLVLIAQERSALVIIDVQSSFTDMMKKDRAKEFLEAVNDAIEDQRPEEVIFIKANIKVLSISLKGIKVIQAENLDLDSRLNIKKNDHIWMKNDGSAFSIPELNAYLDSLEINHVKIAGLYAEECVVASIRDAVAKGFKVSLLEDAVACKKEKRRDRVMEELRAMSID